VRGRSPEEDNWRRISRRRSTFGIRQSRSSHVLLPVFFFLRGWKAARLIIITWDRLQAVCTSKTTPVRAGEELCGRCARQILHRLDTSAQDTLTYSTANPRDIHSIRDEPAHQPASTASESSSHRHPTTSRHRGRIVDASHRTANSTQRLSSPTTLPSKAITTTTATPI
jgi:hypothetical protein